MKKKIIAILIAVLLLTTWKSSFGEEIPVDKLESESAEKSAETEIKKDEKEQQEGEDDAKSTAIEDIVVIEKAEDRHELSEVPVSLSIIDQLELKRTTTTTVGDLLRDVPGVEIFDTGVLAGMKRVMIRGESGSRVLVLVDGQKISEQKSLDGAALLMDVNSIERIEVTKGPTTVLHGSEGLGGVINVITKKSGRKAFRLETSNAFNTNTDGWNNYISVYGGGEKLHGFGYRLSVANTDHGNQRVANREVLERTNFHNSERNAYLEYAFRDIKLGVSLTDYTSSTNAYKFKTEPYDFNTPPAGWDDPAFKDQESYMEFRQMALPEWNRKKTAPFVEWNNISNSLFKIRFDAYQQETFKHFLVEPFVGGGGWYPGHDVWMEHQTNPSSWPNKFGYLNIIMNIKNTMETENLAVKTDWLLFDSHYLVLGAEYHFDDLDSTTKKEYPPGSSATLWNCGTKYEFTRADRKSWDIFGQNEWNLAEDWIITFGFRYSEVKSRLISDRRYQQREFDTILFQYADEQVAFYAPGSPNFDPLLWMTWRDHRDNIDLLGAKPDKTIREPGSTSEYASNHSFSVVNNSFNNLSLRFHYGTSHAMPSLLSLFIWTSQAGVTLAPNHLLRPETAENFEIGARYSTSNWNIDLTLFRTFTKDYLTVIDLPAAFIRGAGRMRVNLNGAETRGAELEASYTFQRWGLTPYVVGHYLKRTFFQKPMTLMDGAGDMREVGTDLVTDDTGLPLIQGRFGIRYEHLFDDDKRFWFDLYGRAAKSAIKVGNRSAGGPFKERAVLSHIHGWETANFSCGLSLPLFLENSDADLVFAVNNIFDRSYKTAYQKIMEAPGRHFTFKLNMRF